MYYPFMDYYITELTAILLENGGRYQAQYLIRINLSRLTPETVDVIFDTYKTDLRCGIVMFKAEIKRWKARWATLTTAKPSNRKETLNVTNEELYPSIRTVLLILYTMPASTATTERSFSALRRLKTYLRTTMLHDRLTSLAVLNVHRDIDIDIDMRSFTLGKSRHIDFGYGH